MALTFPLYSILFTFLLFFSLSAAQKSIRPRALILPVTKDPSTKQYLTHLNQRTPLVSVKLTVDIGAEFLWVNCEGEGSYVSSSYNPVHCAPSNTCSVGYCFDCFGPPSPGCNNNTCRLVARNPFGTFGGSISNAEVQEDVISLQSTDGSNPGPVVSMRRYLLGCAEKHVLEFLAAGVQGMAGLGRSKVSLPSQLATAFKFDRKFAICLSPSTKSTGVIFFGKGPYIMHPKVDVSKALQYTPLLTKKYVGSMFYNGDAPSEYYIGVKSIKVNGKIVPVNSTKLAIGKYFIGGTRISTLHPYTVLETSIFNAVMKAFRKVIKDVPRVKSVAPFKECYNGKSLKKTNLGPVVPTMDLVMHEESVIWRIYGANSMVGVGNDKMCVGFVDGGNETDAAIVIGGHQLEDNLVQFDTANKRLGFSSSLLLRKTACDNFNFTSVA